MRYVAILLAAFPLIGLAQPAETDQRVLQTLLAEVQQLRAAIERQTLLGTRTQIAISQLQLQESRVTRLNQELTGVREENAQISTEKARLTEGLKNRDGNPPPEIAANPRLRSEWDEHIRGMKSRLEEATAQEQRKAARESELASQLQAAERAVGDSRSRIAEMERVLDVAIQQMLKPR